MDTHQISAEHLPMNNAHYTAETELLLPMCVSVLNETAAMCSSGARPGSFTGTWLFFLKHYWRYNPDV